MVGSGRNTGTHEGWVRAEIDAYLTNWHYEGRDSRSWDPCLRHVQTGRDWHEREAGASTVTLAMSILQFNTLADVRPGVASPSMITIPPSGWPRYGGAYAADNPCIGADPVVAGEIEWYGGDISAATNAAEAQEAIDVNLSR